MKKLIELLDRQSRPFLIALGILLVAVLEAIDYLTGPEIAFSIFYLLPVSLTTWFVGRREGFLICVISATAWFIAEVLTGPAFSNPLIPYWNMLVRFGFFLVVTYALAALKRSLEHEKELARKDHLTGSINVRAFYELADMEIHRARRNKLPFTVAYMDIDDFKIVNDRFGHSVGDTLLRTVTETITSNIRRVDVVARLGGDEFAILLPETGEAEAEVVIRRVRQHLLEMAQQNAWPVTFSIGVVTCDSPPQSVDKMLKIADDLMYSVKNKGKNMVKHTLSSESVTAA